MTSQSTQAEERASGAEQKRASAQTRLDTLIPQLETAKSELDKIRELIAIETARLNDLQNQNLMLKNNENQ